MKTLLPLERIRSVGKVHKVAAIIAAASVSCLPLSALANHTSGQEEDTQVAEVGTQAEVDIRGAAPRILWPPIMGADLGALTPERGEVFRTIITQISTRRPADPTSTAIVRRRLPTMWPRPLSITMRA